MNDRAAFEDGYNVGKLEAYSAGFHDGMKLAHDIVSAKPVPIVIHLDRLPEWLTGSRPMTDGDL